MRTLERRQGRTQANAPDFYFVSHEVSLPFLSNYLFFAEMPEVEVDFENQVKGFRYGQVRFHLVPYHTVS